MHIAETNLRLMAPHTYEALHRLVTTMDDVARSNYHGFPAEQDGSDQTRLKLFSMIRLTIQAMALDGVVNETTPTEQLLSKLEMKVNAFSLAFPNWPDAYGFANEFFVVQRDYALALIDMLRRLH